MSYQDLSGLRFAFRWWEIVPLCVEKCTSPCNHALEHKWSHKTAESYAGPPRIWKARSAGQAPWIIWKAEPQGNGQNYMSSGSQYTQIHERDTTSIVWCQESQSYWIASSDRSNPRVDEDTQNDGERPKHWTHLYFHHHHYESQHPYRHIYRIHGYGDQRQLDFMCPTGFNDFIPSQKFTGNGMSSESGCHLIGKLSLILALNAMYPEDTGDIGRHIRDTFWRNQSPILVAANNPDVEKRNRLIAPGRALVVQTGLIAEFPEASADDIRITQWENGVYGPMVSSY